MYTVCPIAKGLWKFGYGKMTQLWHFKIFWQSDFPPTCISFFQFYHAWIYEDYAGTIHWILHQLSNLQYELGDKFVDTPLKVYIRHCVARNADKTKECLEFYVKNQVQLFSLKFKDHWMILGQMLMRAVDQNNIVQFCLIE